MRPFVLLIVSILAMGGLAGCFGSDKDGATADPATATPGSGTSTPGAGGVKTYAVHKPLTSTITSDAPAWIASGTEVPVKLEAPANAKGALTYAWAAGPLPGTTAVVATTMDTGSTAGAYIQSGASKSLTFSTPGVFAMHCHPHPFMRHNVTVIEGYAGPKNVEVAIVDGASTSEFVFVPENIVVGVGTTVTYKNVGMQPHTSTALGAQEPPLKALPLKTESGTVKIEGNGWMRILAIVQDSEGRLGIINKSIYVTPELPTFPTKTETMSFTYGSPGPLGGSPAESAPKSVPVTLEQGGLVTITYEFKDAAGGSPLGQNFAEVEGHFKKDGETQDTLTGAPGDSATLTGKAIAGAYSLTIVPLQGTNLEGTITIDVVYDLVPPMPTMPEEGGHDDGGGHQH